MNRVFSDLKDQPSQSSKFHILYSIMSLPKQLQETFTAKEIAFMAEQELITILPRYSMHGTRLIGPKLPNLKAMHRETIPIWLALIFKRQDKCNIVIPDWLQLDYLRGKYEEETRKPNNFSKLPWHWLTISKLLLDNCLDDFTDPAHEVRSTLQDLREVRLLKARRGLKELNEVYLRLDGLSLIEINEIRPFIIQVMDQLRKLKASASGEDEFAEDADMNDENDVAEFNQSSYNHDSVTVVAGDTYNYDDDDSDEDIYRKD